MNSSLEHKRHSLAHLLAAAVLELYPDAKRAIGPAIENGFYYDFGDLKITDEDLPKIEAKMREILPTWKEFHKATIPAKDARKLFADNPYKLELIDEYEKDGLTTYTSGTYMDLCRGGHSLEIDPEAFKLTHLAGAYWRGSEKNPMLTRIYGLAFDTKKELDEYLVMLEEAKKRDHKVLGPKFGLFMFHETAPGMPYWLPKGMVVLNELIEFWRQEHASRGYHEISSPLINKKELWETSGHWEHYRENMFLAEMDGQIYGVKAMNCPNAMIVFGSHHHSYRDLPYRLSDTDILHRYELSGTLNGLLRVRSFRQDDSHNFITEDQIEEEYERILEIAEKFYGVFGLEYRLRLGTRPENFMGEPELWDKAEAALLSILKKQQREHFVLEGDGAFYGPKIDILMKDALGREWQMGTIQLDFQQPRRFDLHYIDQDGQKKTPVVVHRVIYGSLDRFIGLILEHFAGAFPLWLAPVQVAILPVADRHVERSRNIADQLREHNIRVEIDESNEKLGKKIREAEMMKIPYLVILGDKELEAGKIAVRKRGGEDLGQVELENFIEKLLEEIKTKTL
ncbi:MAG: threonine--tRNA ligase [Patescibacteria group bacterium]